MVHELAVGVAGMSWSLSGEYDCAGNEVQDDDVSLQMSVVVQQKRVTI